MNFLRHSYILLSMLATSLSAGAQEFYQHDTTVKVFAYGKEQTLAWCGGFNNPQFSEADLNHDGKKDLVVYESGLGISTFLNVGLSDGLPSYRYEPKYALNFPPTLGYLLMRDYNCDGIADLFQRGSDGIAVYRGYYDGANELKFIYYQDLLYFNDALTGGPANAFVNPGDIPGIADVDNDGDLDFVAYYITGGYMYYYKNMRVEEGLPCDSIRIKLKDRCWGKVYQGFYRTHGLGYSCSNAGLARPAAKVTHSGNAICLFDWDLDGDMDYLDGSVSFNELTFLKNGRVEHSSPIDSMVDQDTLWQTGGKRLDIPVWPAAFTLDADQDGRTDILVAPNGGSGSENYNCIWYYRNNSTPGAPDWQFKSDSFLTDRTIDLGTASYPTLFDYNKDGKPDLIVGSDGYRQSSGLLKSRLSLYLNTSSPSGASFTLESKDLATLSAQNFSGAAPGIGDIDDDGFSDLVLGHSDGTLSYYKNMAGSETVQPDWQLNQLVLKDEGGNDINVGGAAAPLIYDLDKDGKKDLIIGNLYGYLQYYRNVSTAAGSIKLKLITTKVGKAKADPLQNIGCYSAPFIGKLDASGTDYLLLGSNSGNIYQYTGFQSGDTTGPYTLVDGSYSYIDSTHNRYNHPGTTYGIYSNHRSTVTVGDIDGSGSYTMIKGNIKGGLEFYKRKVYIASTPDTYNSCEIKVYPNPASNVLNVSWRGIASGEVDLRVVDMTGKVCVTVSAAAMPGNSTVMINHLPPGIYICMLQSGTCKYYSKFTVLR
ncbi:MAG: T9SS type A sorting domain-containing protein [Taibaiella sp.]|nr:T9SS type A sorting domain-containing protein [Taibaiella sp.]